MIREFRGTDLERLREITVEVFGPAAIDQYLETKFGLIAGRDWKWRKARHIDDDVRANGYAADCVERWSSESIRDSIDPYCGAHLLPCRHARRQRGDWR